MRDYLLRRLLLGLLTLVLITLVVYGLICSMPGDPLALQALVAADAGGQINEDYYQEMRRELGLDRHWALGYAKWLGDLLRGDLGRSVHERSPVMALIGPRIGPTLLLSVSSLLLAYLLAIPLGLYCGARSGRLPERALSTLLYMLYSLPSFVAALYLLLYLVVKRDWMPEALERWVPRFPLSGMRSPDEEYRSLSAAGKAFDLLWHLALPVACSTYGALAYYVRFIRSNLQEVLRQDYIRTARAKGLSERTVVLKHAFRNSLIPLVTLLGLTVPTLLGGSVILERIFRWPGMGLLFFERIAMRDYPVIMALVLLFSVLVLLGNLLADVLYAVVDPRITYS